MKIQETKTTAILTKQLKHPKIQVILLIALLAVWGMTKGNVQSKLLILSCALASTVFTELAIFGHLKSTMLQSSVITGLIIGVLAAPVGSSLFVWVAAIVGIASKRFIKFNKNRHIFNPAAFGLVVSSLLFSNQISWWGNSSFIIIIIGSGFILFRLNRLSMPFAYVLFRILSALAFGTNLTDATLLPNLFFAFIMLIEPKTSPSKRVEQWMFGGICGLLATLFYNVFASFEGDLLALLAVNLSRPLFSKCANSKIFKKDRRNPT